MMEPTDEDSVPLRHGVGEGKAPSSSAPQWLPRKLPRVPDVGFKMAVFALFFSVFVGQITMLAGQFLTLRELKEMNSKLTPPTPEILFAPPPPPPHVVPGGALEYKVVSWEPSFSEGADATGTQPDSAIKPEVFCMCSGEPCRDRSQCDEVYIGNSSMLSFVEVLRGEGLTNEDIFASCKAPVISYKEHVTEAIYLWNFTKVVPYAFAEHEQNTYGKYKWSQGSKNCSRGFENDKTLGGTPSLSTSCSCHEANEPRYGDDPVNLGTALDSLPFAYCQQNDGRGRGLGLDYWSEGRIPLDGCCWDRIETGEKSSKKITYGDSWGAMPHMARSCVLEKLMNKLGQDGWSLRDSDILQAQPSLYFVRQAL